MDLLKPFLIFSFLGWTVENIKNWNDRKFIPCNTLAKYFTSDKICLGPFFPIYGIGGLFIAFMSTYKYQIPILARLLIYAIVFNVIELIGGYIGEHYICNHVNTCQNGAKMWNYKGGYNYKGYIDAEHTFYWILLGLIGELLYESIMDYDISVMAPYILMGWTIISLHNYRKF